MRVLLVEDEALIGLELAMTMEEWGIDVDGPHKFVATALDALSHEAPDFAILDVNLGRGETSIPVAEALVRADVPFLFVTGYARERIESAGHFSEVEVLRKPVALDTLQDRLTQAREVAEAGAARADGTPAS